MVKRLIFICIFCLLTVTRILAETEISTDLTLYNNLTRVGENDWSCSLSGTGIFALHAAKTENIQAQLSFENQITNDQFSLDIYRAYVKVRFPGFRSTIGKQRLSWGEGQFFNAGDVIYDSVSLGVDISASTLRDEAKWLSSLNIPLGMFSFVETLVLFPEVDLDASNPSDIHETSVGARVLTKAFNTKIESGYLFNGTEEKHSVYISLQGSLYLDWYVSLRTSVFSNNPLLDDMGDNFILSPGFYYIIKLYPGSTLAIRLEGLIHPSASWSEKDETATSEEYGAYLFTELSWSLSSLLTLMVRDVFSPVDSSSLILTGVSWNLLTGLHILGNITFQLGDNNDTFGWNQSGSPTLSIGLRYVY